MFHGNLVHASPPNITPYPRKIVYLTLCAVSNHITKFTRPEWIAHRDFTPIKPADDDALVGIRPRAPGGGGIKFSVIERMAHGSCCTAPRIYDDAHCHRCASVIELPDFARPIAAGARGALRGITMYTLYSDQRSGNSYKVRLALARLGIPFKLVEVDILQGASRTPEFLAKNPNGHVPLLEVAPNRYLAKSNAILWYVAGGTTLAPEDRIDRAEAMQWMFFEQHSLEPNIGAAYFWLALVKGGRDLQQHALEDWMENGYRALGVMEMHLASHRFFAANHFTIADIALYAYTHVANQADFDLARYPGDARLARPRRGGTRPCGDGLAAGSAYCGAVIRRAFTFR